MTGLRSDSQVLMMSSLHRFLQSIRYYKDGDATHVRILGGQLLKPIFKKEKETF